MKTKLNKKILWPALAVPALACLMPMANCSLAAPTTHSANSTDISDAPAGLDAVVKDGEAKVLDELSNDGLSNLLDHEFDVDNTPQKQRDAITAIGAIRLINDPSRKLTPRQKLDLVEKIAAGLELAKASLPKSPTRLEQYAQILYLNGAKYYESTLEYWGESSLTQGHLKPIADAMCDLYKMASDSAEEDCGKAAQANDLLKARNLDQESQFDTYYGTLLQYDRALATDASTPAGKALRKQICKDAIDNLKQYDDPSTTVQPVVELNIAKDYALEGKTADADTLFDNLIAGKTSPVPTPDQINDAYYFKTAGHVLANDPAGASHALADMVAFQKTLPELLANAKWNQDSIKGMMDSVDTLNQLLQYRIGMLDADAAKTPAEKNKATEAAATVLENLATKHPELQGLIYEQLVNCLPPTQPVAQMDPLLLQAVMNKGLEEYHKPADQQDKKLMQRGLDAAEEVLARTDRKGISPEFSEDAAKAVPALDVALGNDIAAANAYLDYVEKYNDKDKQHHDDADAMVHLTYGLLDHLQRTAPDTANLGPTYERFLKIAVNPPFNYTEFCYAYGLMLQGEHQFTKAAEFLKKVSPSDGHYASARINLLEVEHQIVDTPTNDPVAHKAAVQDLISVATEIKNRYANSTDKTQRLQAAYATLLAAQAAINDLNPADPKTALDLTDNLDSMIAGLGQEKEFKVDGLFVRYPAHMALNQSDKATADLVQIMDNAPGDTGAQMVDHQLVELNKQYDVARGLSEMDKMRDISRNEAKLSGFLANWAKTNTNPVNRKAYYSYALFDAHTKRIAGSLENDPASKEADLKQALAQYDFLASPAGHALYLDQLSPDKKQNPNFDPADPDVNVELGRALTQYGLHDYLDAQQTLSDLLANGKLGSATATNDTFWEATYDLYMCNYELAKQGNALAQKNLDQTKAGLKGVFIIGGIPAQWKGDFDDLREKLIPDWKVPDETATPAKQQSASSK